VKNRRNIETVVAMDKVDLTPAGIQANISYYEALVQNSKEEWNQHLESLQFWLDQLELHQPVSDSTGL